MEEGSITGTITNGTVRDQDQQIVDDQTLRKSRAPTSTTERTTLSIESSDDSSGAIVSTTS